MFNRDQEGTAIKIDGKIILLPPKVKVVEQSFSDDSVQLTRITELLIVQTEILFALLPQPQDRDWSEQRDQLERIKNAVNTLIDEADDAWHAELMCAMRRSVDEQP